MSKEINSKIQFWVVNSLEKAFPKSRKPKRSEQSITLFSASNETEDAQILIRPKLGLNLNKVSFSFTDLSSTQSKIPKESLNGYWEWYTHVRKNARFSKLPWMHLKHAPAFFPDGFLEEKSIKIQQMWTHPLWVSVKVPKDTPKGKYKGSIQLHCEYTNPKEKVEGLYPKPESTIISIPITIIVWGFNLPGENTLRHTEWFFPDLLARYFRVDLWSEKHWDLVQQAAEDMHEHLQDMILTSLFQLVDVIQKSKGEFEYNFSKLDRWITTFSTAGIKWFEIGHVGGRVGGWLSKIAFTRIKPIDENGKQLDTFEPHNMSEKEYIPILEDFIRASYAFLSEKIDLNYCVQHIADEPLKQNKESWSQIAKLMRSWIPKEVKTIDAAFTKNMEGIDIRVPQIQHIHPSERNKTEGLEPNLWSYVCLAPQGNRPNRFLDYRSIRNRIIFWISYSLKLEGFLHWAYNWWSSWTFLPKSVDISPWMDSTAGSIYCHFRQPLPAGDPHIVYPGRTKICSSIRWEIIRKGFEDHKLLTLLEKIPKSSNSSSLLGERAEKLLSKVKNHVAKSSRKYTKNSNKLLHLRIQIGYLLDEFFENNN